MVVDCSYVDALAIVEENGDASVVTASGVPVAVQADKPVASAPQVV